MKNYEIKVQEITKILNEFKSKNETFTRSSFTQIKNLTYAQHWIGCLLKYNLIQRISHGNYIWTSKNPIYIKVIESILNDFKSYFKDGSKSKITSKVIETHTLSEEEKAIRLLKNLGYKIMKPINNFVEI